MRWTFGLGVSLFAAMLVTHKASADDWAISHISEVRGGVASTASDHPSPSGDVQILFSPLPPVAAVYDANWAWLFAPRPLIGAAVSLSGKTNEAYAGLAWNIPVIGRYFVEVSAGGLVHDQELNRAYDDRTSPLTTRFLFRESIALGYDINADWRVMLYADHGSNGNLGYRNEGVNRVGLLLGRKFEPVAAKPAVAAAPMADLTWAGPYAGFGVGLARSKFALVSPAPTPDKSSNDDDSVNFAVQAGYNWAYGLLVAGLEADYSIQGVNGNAIVSAADAAFSGSSLWLVTTRARLGADVAIPLVAPRSLIYATGGAAFSRIANGTCTNMSTQCFTAGGDIAGGWSVNGALRTGLAAGGGIELPLAPTVSAKFEYLYVDFGNTSFSNGGLGDEIAFKEHILRTGMNFKLH